MRAEKCVALGMFTLGLSMAGGLAFGNGYIMPPELVDKIQIGVTTSKQVTEILGPPASVAQFPRRGVVTWDYTTTESFNKKKSGVSIEIDGNGIVRNIVRFNLYGP